MVEIFLGLALRDLRMDGVSCFPAVFFHKHREKRLRAVFVGVEDAVDVDPFRDLFCQDRKDIFTLLRNVGDRAESHEQIFYPDLLWSRFLHVGLERDKVVQRVFVFDVVADAEVSDERDPVADIMLSRIVIEQDIVLVVYGEIDVSHNEKHQSTRLFVEEKWQIREFRVELSEPRLVLLVHKFHRKVESAQLIEFYGDIVLVFRREPAIQREFLDNGFYLGNITVQNFFL